MRHLQAEHLIDRSVDSHLLLHNCHHAIGGYRSVDLDPHGVLGLTPELFYLQMLLQPLEEELNLPAVTIEFCDHHRADI